MAKNKVAPFFPGHGVYSYSVHLLLLLDTTVLLLLTVYV